MIREGLPTVSVAIEKREVVKSESTVRSWGHHTTTKILDVLRPSIFTQANQKALNSTSWLDGLRGFAAFLVYWQHHQGWAHVGSNTNTILETAFGYKDQYFFACLPGIRLFFTGGHLAVSIFFFISGYVLSTKPLSLIHSGKFVELEDSLASSMFRRWPRLFLPAAFTTFIYATSWHLFEIWTAVPVHQDTWIQEVIHWAGDFSRFSWLFRGGTTIYTEYNFHLWSIAVEFRGSIVIFTSLLAFSRCSRNARLLCQMVLIFYFLFITEGMLYAMFSAGMLLCDLDMLARSDNLPSFFDKYLQPYKKIIFNSLFVFGVYLGGVPAIDFNTNISLLEESPGWKWLARLKPTSVSESDYKWFYLFWASLFILSSVSHTPHLKSFFETRFNQYLGRISFSFYLVHGPILWTLADRMYLAAGLSRVVNVDGIRDWIGIFPLHQGGPLGLQFAFLVPHLLVFPITCWVAEISTKLFDKPSNRFASWAYRKALS